MLTKGLLLAVDANSILHRAFHAYPLTLTTTDNQPVNAVYGFTSMFLDALLTFKPEYVFCAFDTPKPTFRHSTYVGYKANRPQTDLELISQIPYVHEVLKALNIPVFSVEGFEADDVLGTVCSKLKTERFHSITQSYVLTGDRDLFQLVSDKVQVILPKGSFKNLEVFDDQKVLSAMGVMPSQITDLKGLMGDASDNIPGVKGIGPKTASDLLGRYSTVEGVYEHIQEVSEDNKRVAQLLVNDHQNAVMSKELATISLEAPVTFSEDDAETRIFDPRVVAQLFSTLQFKSLFPKFNKFLSITGNSLEKEAESPTVAFVAEKKSIESIGDVSDVSIEQIPVQQLSFAERLAVIGKKSAEKGLTLYIYAQENLWKFHYPKATLPIESISTYSYGLFPLFSSALTEGEVSSWKSLIGHLLDVELLSYAQHTGKEDYSLQDNLTQLGKGILFEELQKDAADVGEVALGRILSELEIAQNYEAIDRVRVLWENPGYIEAPVPVLQALYEDFSVLLSVSLMRLRGVKIDRETVKKTISAYKQTLEGIEKDIFDIVGFEFNVRSPKQLSNVLFGNLVLPNARKTKTGFSTDDEVLQGLVGAHPVVMKIIEHRQIAKLISTYMEPYVEIIAVEPEESQTATQFALFAEAVPVAATHTDARIHSQFSIMSTSSGRLSSSQPNLQNLPVKSELGKVIREFFVPEQGHKILSIDYSQIDLRVLAHISEDEGLLAAFAQQQDIHRSTAAKVFHVPFAEVTDSQRRFAKSINFGLVYGMSAFGLSRSIGVDVKEAAGFIDEYFQQFPRVKEYMSRTVSFAKETGYVLSLLGRRRYIAGITSNNKMRVQGAEREAINMPIQGGADDIMRLALGKISLTPEVLSGKIKVILQVHDELVFELPDNQAFIQEKQQEFISIMESVIPLKVPLKAEAAVGDNLAI